MRKLESDKIISMLKRHDNSAVRLNVTITTRVFAPFLACLTPDFMSFNAATFVSPLCVRTRLVLGKTACLRVGAL